LNTIFMFMKCSTPIIGIYLITCKSSGRKYVGQSRNIRKRWSCHRKERFAIELFDYQILEECAIEMLDERECFYIQALNTLEPSGFNVKRGGQGWDMIFTDEVRKKLSYCANHMSQETRAKISATSRGRVSSDETRRKQSEASKQRWKNAPMTEETRKKISDSVRNIPVDVRKQIKDKRKPMSEETRRKISESLKNISDETRAKIGAASRGRISSEETRRKQSEALKDRQFSSDHRALLAEGARRMWERRRAAKQEDSQVLADLDQSTTLHGPDCIP